MASALSPPRVPKPKGALPSHYYENFLEKKGPCDRDYKKFWAGLKGCTLYFYNSNRDSQHVEKLDLTALVKLTDDPPWGSSRDPGIHFSLVLRNQEIKFKFSCDSLDAVVNYFVTRTKKSLVPFLPDEDYEKVLGYMEADNENGESVWVAREAPASRGPGPAPPSGGPRQLPPVPVTPVSSPNKLTPLPNEDENYVIPIAHTPAATYMNGDVPSPSRPVIWKPKKVAKVQAKPPKLPKPPVAPKPEPQGLNGGLAKKLAGNSAQAFSPTTGLADLTAELEEKLRRRRALEHSARHAGDL
ncbi:signal-transducing adaptor protein 2 [Puma concolor]|uniref:Signal-transducing adaptor protein 2 n=1 Tax=Puma concolor TaxID=9696 RepID=A0A6P6H9C5_PUMCO|nr:signal-transducing adaptor protein 2 [Puma concolor]